MGAGFVVAILLAGKSYAQQSGDICDVLKRKDSPLYARNARGLRAHGGLDPQEIINDVLAQSGVRQGNGIPPQIQAIAVSPLNFPEIRGNAEAKFCPDTHEYVFYDPDYMDRLSAGSGKPWAVYFLFAHEVGHHQSAATTNNSGDLPQLELSADHYAAFTLARMGATLSELIRAVDMIADENDGHEHPGRLKREAAVREGYSDEHPVIVEPPAADTGRKNPPQVQGPAFQQSSGACQTGNLVYDSQCASCDRQRLSILEAERNGTISAVGRMSFYNYCTAKGVQLGMPAPAASAKLSSSDYQQCVQTRLQIADFERSGKLAPATLKQIEGAYRAGYCGRAETQPSTDCQRYLEEWQNRGNYQYRNQPGAMKQYEDGLRKTLHVYSCPGF
jgi:hypothetical protein